MISNISYPVQNPLLVPYIRDYFVLDFSNLPQERIEMKVPPMGFPVLQFHFGEQSNFYSHKHLTCQSIFIGQLSRHVALYPSKGLKLVGINFKPYGLYNLLGISPRNILNSGVESSLFFGEEKVKHISDTLKQKGIDEGIAEIEKLLFASRNKNIKQNHYFDRLVDSIEKENGLVNYAELLNKNVSVRTLQRYFRDIIGISPKLFCQVLRHKYIMMLLYQKTGLQWSNMLLNGFYYDFSHFTKDFTLFSGLTPKKFLPIKNNFTFALLEA